MPVPPVPYRFVADLDAPLLQVILDIAQRQREADVEHHRQTDDLGAGLEVAKRRAFGHALRLAGRPARGNQSSSDNTGERHEHETKELALDQPRCPFRRGQGCVRRGRCRRLTHAKTRRGSGLPVPRHPSIGAASAQMRIIEGIF